MKLSLIIAFVLVGCASVETAGSGYVEKTDRSSEIRYDDKTITPRGFIDYCAKYPQRKECGGSQ